MKKMNVFNLIAIASLCAVALHGAVPPAESPAARMAREQVEVYQEATGTKLDAPAPQIIQEYLKAQRVPIKIIYNGRGPKQKIFEVIFRDIPTGSILASATVSTRVRHIPVYRTMTDPGADEVEVHIPLIPVEVTINRVHYEYTEDGGRETARLKKVSFELSMKELSAIESITINRQFAEIKDKTGAAQQKYFKVDPIPFNLPTE